MARHISKPSDREALQKLLRKTRRDAGMGQVALARRLGKPQPFVSRYETGERRLDILELREVCRVCGVSLGQFLRKLEAALKRS